jgi:hypothetical protein
MRRRPAPLFDFFGTLVSYSASRTAQGFFDLPSRLAR